ncbi:hypothetical protein B0H11DRAFT_1940621 [Mycena galericulata]|nr:hypothetical protein B0H11DRAFT_1940621 [Mycena galericulata]
MKDVEKIPEDSGGMKDIIPDRRTGISPEAGRRPRDAGRTAGTGGKWSGGSIGNHPSRSGSGEKYPIGTMTYLTLDKLAAFVKVSTRKTGPGVPEHPERKGKSEDGKTTWKKTRREEFCNDSKKYRELKGAGMKSPGPGCTGTKAGAIVTRVYGKESDDPLGQNRREREKGIHGWSRRAPECSRSPKSPDEVPKAGRRTGGVRRRPEQSEEDINVVVELGTTRKEWRKSGIKSAGGAGGLQGEEDHPCKDDQTSHREPSVKDWKGVKHSTGTMAYPMLVKPVTFAKVAYRTVDFGKSLEKLPEEAQRLPGGTRRSGNVVPELETIGKEEENIGMESGDGAGELRRTVENHPSRSGSVEILYGHNGLSDAGIREGPGQPEHEMPEVPEAWEHSSQYLEAHGGAPKKCGGVEHFQGVLGRRTDDNRIHRGKGPEGRRPERTQMEEHDGAGGRKRTKWRSDPVREIAGGEREAKSGWSENSGGGWEEIHTSERKSGGMGIEAPRYPLKDLDLVKMSKGLWRRHTGETGATG